MYGELTALPSYLPWSIIRHRTGFTRARAGLRNIPCDARPVSIVLAIAN